MKIHDAIEAIVGSLHRHPIFQSPDVVADVNHTGRLDAGKNTFSLGHIIKLFLQSEPNFLK
jgi:hypothetical protein